MDPPDPSVRYDREGSPARLSPFFIARTWQDERKTYAESSFDLFSFCHKNVNRLMGCNFPLNVDGFHLFDFKQRPEQRNQLAFGGKVENRPERSLPVFPDSSELRAFLAEADGQVFPSGIEQPVNVADIFYPAAIRYSTGFPREECSGKFFPSGLLSWRKSPSHRPIAAADICGSFSARDSGERGLLRPTPQPLRRMPSPTPQ